MRKFMEIDRTYETMEQMISALCGYTREYAEYVLTHVGSFERDDSYGKRVVNGKVEYYLKITAWEK